MHLQHSWYQGGPAIERHIWDSGAAEGVAVIYPMEFEVQVMAAKTLVPGGMFKLPATVCLALLRGTDCEAIHAG